MISTAWSTFASGTSAATSLLPRPAASANPRASSRPKPRATTSPTSSSSPPSRIAMSRSGKPALTSSSTTLPAVSLSNALMTDVGISRFPSVGCSCDRGGRPSVGGAVPGLGRVEALDDGLLAPERDPLLGVAGGGPPRDPDLLGGAQALLDPHPHLLVEGDDGRVALLPHRDGSVDPAVE